LARGLSEPFKNINKKGSDPFSSFLWEKLKNQVYLGSDQFVEQMQGHLEPDRNLSEVPVGQKRRVAPPLKEYERVSGGRDEAIVAACVRGGYTMKEIGEHFGLHYSRISRLVRDSLSKHKT